MTKRRTVFSYNNDWGLYFSTDTTGMPTDWTHVELDLNDLVYNGTAHLSAQYDIADKYGMISDWWRWRACFKFQGDPTDGELLKLYLCAADNTDATKIDGGFLQAATGTVAEADLSNADNFGNVDAGQQDSSISSGLVKILDRYISIAVNNTTTAAAGDTTDVSGDSWIKLWPVTKIVLP